MKAKSIVKLGSYFIFMISFAVCLFVLAAQSAMGLDVVELLRPKGPSLMDKAYTEWREFEVTLPDWFVINIDYTPGYVWGPCKQKQGFYKNEFAVWHREVCYKEDGKCWVEERQEIDGYWNTLRYGTLHVVLKVEKDASLKMLHLYHNAHDLMGKDTLSAVVESQDKSILKFLIEQIPYAGEVIEKASTILETGNTQEKLDKIQEGLGKFVDEYESVKRLIDCQVVTVKGGYRGAVRLGGDRIILDTFSRIVEVKGEGDFWDSLGEGEKRTYTYGCDPVEGDAADTLIKTLSQPKDQRDYTFLLGEPNNRSVGGKYSVLLHKLYSPQDKEKHGCFWDESGGVKWNVPEYRSYENLQEGFWVWAYPFWYVWGESLEAE